VISAIANMFASSLRSVTRNGPLAARSFSSTAATSAAEVKSLGVIGAGQMVSNMHGQRGLFRR
jgi:3-hydroxybutyryl-CoA dehydrogenase